MSAAAGGVELFAGGHEAGTHGGSVSFAACPDPDATEGGRGEGTMIVGEGEVRFRLPGFVVGAEAKIFVDLVGVDELVGIQAVGGIEDALELPEGLHEVFAEHLGVERGTGLAVSVFSGERASVGESDVGGLIDEATEFENAFRGFEIEVDAHVDAALTEVSVHGA